VNASEITPLILTYNEASNIGRTLDSLHWAASVVVVDSGSDDGTLSICAEYPQVQVVTRSFDSHTNQWNFGLDQIQTPWVLTLDADYRCPSDFDQEVGELDDTYQAYAIPFRYALSGTVLRGSLYPPRVALFRPQKFRYINDGHTQLLDTGGQSVGSLKNQFIHDDRKSHTRWLRSQIPYATLECDKLCTTRRQELDWKDRIRLWIVVAPVLTFFYCLIYRRLIWDGKAGLLYTLQRTYAELLLSFCLLHRRFAPAALQTEIDNSGSEVSPGSDVLLTRKLNEYQNPEYNPGRGIVVRLLWYFVSLWIFESSWFLSGGLKRRLLRLFGAKIGFGLVIHPNVRIKYPWRLSIANDCWIGREVWIDNIDDVVLESDVCISQGAYLCTGSHDHRSATFELQTAPITIKHGAWICCRAVVLGGSTVQRLSVVAANQVYSRQGIRDAAAVTEAP
jgi:acetyltransferase-like isoleucine patch superfamily enzyme